MCCCQCLGARDRYLVSVTSSSLFVLVSYHTFHFIISSFVFDSWARSILLGFPRISPSTDGFLHSAKPRHDDYLSFKSAYLKCLVKFIDSNTWFLLWFIDSERIKCKVLLSEIWSQQYSTSFTDVLIILWTVHPTSMYIYEYDIVSYLESNIFLL